MSGGVDSSVSAAILKQQDYEVVGMMMRLWSEGENSSSNRCCTLDSMMDAQKVADKIGIPFYVLNAQDIFREVVVKYFINGYQKGITPNPCIICNQKIRWEYLFQRAIAGGADFFSTGHYARIENRGDNYILKKGLDQNKDQSYVLHTLTQEKLSRTILPLGMYTKQEVRKMARNFSLPVSERGDSQDLCFIGKGKYTDFLLRHTPETILPGPIKFADGTLVGEHKGLAYYTIGQRKGLGISSTIPLYVIDKKIASNEIIVGPENELGQHELIAKDVNWISGSPDSPTLIAGIQVRYRGREVQGSISHLSTNEVQVKFSEPIRDITPGQAVVFYDKDICLGGGIIE